MNLASVQKKTRLSRRGILRYFEPKNINMFTANKLHLAFGYEHAKEEEREKGEGKRNVGEANDD